MFTEADKKQVAERGSELSNVEKQIENFINGFPPLSLMDNASEGNGIRVLNQVDRQMYIDKYESLAKTKSLCKFVPASGAASRMFKALFAFTDEYKGTDEEYEQFSQEQIHPAAFQFFKCIHDFAFHRDLKEVYSKGPDSLEEAHIKREYVSILKSLLTDKGLNYGSLPKGLLKFHQYGDSSRTPAEEHLVEGANYAKGEGDKVALHFTVSPEHRAKFEEHIRQVKGGYESQFGVTYEVSYSEQMPSTDTIAVNLDNEPFRNADGTLLFRPAGHGALIENLNQIDADLIFVKNVDNVVPDHLKAETYVYKKVLAGVLLEVQEKVFRFIEKIDADWSDSLEKEIIGYAADQLNIKLPSGFSDQSESERRQFLRNKLNRPIRVSGMVSNVGDPGGGPFWALNTDGSVSLQIVETAQIDLSKPDQKSIFDGSTHFNPVDLVCGVKDINGEKFDLTQFVDPSTGFITQKSKDGKDLKAQELPGLWNGSMADWITILVEVPVITFNPVKQVNDLLKPTHQPGG